MDGVARVEIRFVVFLLLVVVVGDW